MKDCFLCECKGAIENKLAHGFYDINPVSKGHMIFAPKRHVSTLFETTQEERTAIFELIEKAKSDLDKKYKPDGYNILVNCGEVAGQSVMHAHVHLIPRYKGQKIVDLIK